MKTRGAQGAEEAPGNLKGLPWVSLGPFWGPSGERRHWGESRRVYDVTVYESSKTILKGAGWL